MLCRCSTGLSARRPSTPSTWLGWTGWPTYRPGSEWQQVTWQILFIGWTRWPGGWLGFDYRGDSLSGSVRAGADFWCGPSTPLQLKGPVVPGHSHPHHKAGSEGPSQVSFLGVTLSRNMLFSWMESSNLAGLMFLQSYHQETGTQYLSGSRTRCDDRLISDAHHF